MAELLKGAPVSAAMIDRMKQAVDRLAQGGIVPTLAILRVGERKDDLSYERGAAKRCAEVGVQVKHAVLPEDVAEGEFFDTLDALNADPDVHGILMLRPLPKQIDGEKARQRIRPEKDVDGCTDGSLAGVFAGTKQGFPPCTAQAAMEILHYYGIDPAGKRAAVIGRSLVIGRPVAMMLLKENATVTVCHTKTAELPAVTREADILISAAGALKSLTAEHVRPGQVIIDVSVNWDPEKLSAKGTPGALAGDAVFEEVEPIAAAITPVPGGVGAVTTTVLVSHVVEAALRAAQI